MLVGNFFIFVGERYLKKTSKVSCKALSYGVIPDPFLDLRSFKREQMKGIDALKRYMSGSNSFIYVGGKYLKKTSHQVD